MKHEEIDYHDLSKKWNHLYWISQWKDEYTLYKRLRSNSGTTTLRKKLTDDEAMDIIYLFGLVRFPSSTFRSGASWRRPIDQLFYLENAKQIDPESEKDPEMKKAAFRVKKEIERDIRSIKNRLIS